MTTVNDIKKKLSGYRYIDQAARDSHVLLGNFKNLKVRAQQPFVHPNGSKEKCMSLSGTIPVQISGVNYNIPITIWVRPNHPYVPPMVYVSPTEDMGIQQSRFVDTSGLVYLPYISEWKYGSSDMTTLAQILCATFADHCPVYSKRTAPQQRPWNQPVRPPSNFATPSYSSPYVAGSGGPSYSGQQPRYPQQSQPTPYPMSGGNVAMPTPYGGGGTGNYPYPPTSGQTPYPAQGQYGGFPYSQQPNSPQGSNPAASLPPATTMGATYVAAAAHTATPPSAEEERRQMEEHERIRRQSLETAVEDKIRRHVKQVLDEAQAEMDGMLETQEKLKKGNEEINQMMSEMDSKKREVEESIDMLKTKKAELMSLLDYLRAQPDTIDVDEAVAATNPLYNQILRLYASENAIDDTIYYLGEALRKRVIDLDAFLKHVRELSRQQFMDRATIMKARSAAGLGQHGVPS